MTTEAAPAPVPATVEPPAEKQTWREWFDRLRLTNYGLLLVAAFVGSLVLFAIIAAVKGANPFDVLNSMANTITNTHSLQQDLILTVPIGLAAMAVAIPARAGLVNVGGEGQIIVGMVAAAGVGLHISDGVPGAVDWILMGLAGAVGGAVWAGISGLLRTLLGANEAVTTLLMNFLAADVLLYLILSPWRASSAGQNESPPLPAHAVLPKIPGTDMHWGVVVAGVAVVLAWWLLQKTSWGFALRVVGGNGEAARRSGLKVKVLLLSSMLVGGAFAGLGGALHFAGVEAQLRPDTTATYGYIAFLASFLGRGKPVLVVISAFIFSAITLSGPNLESDIGGLPKTIVNVLLALVVAAPLVVAKYRRKSS
ncbi:MAG TPA: ABC transporter permease [Jatrophihabitans sp.]|jgi:simple sugar transport system permease protein